jgi:hypothetical protein
MREGLFDHHRRDSQQALAAAVGGQPNAQGVLGPVPEGYAWYVENFAYTVVGANHTALIDVAVLRDDGPLPAQATWDHQGLVWTGPAAAQIKGSTNNGVAWYAPAGTFLKWSAAPGTLANGDVVVVTYQIAVHQLDPHFLMSPDDALQVKSAHERMAAELNQDAVGARAN